MGKVLLVVDDSKTIRTAVELIFEGTEYRIVAKETGEAGLAWMRTHTPDLILVDERMPDMDGYDFGSRIKANGKNEDVPILLLACQDGPDESKADTADLDGYVNKPFGSQELVTLVEMLTGSSSLSQMPLSFKEQLLQRQREKQARAARGSQDIEPPKEDELLSLESALASVSADEKKPPKKDEPVVEIPIIENDNAEPSPPVRIESRSSAGPIPTGDLLKPTGDLLKSTGDLAKPKIESKPEPKIEPKREQKIELERKPLPRDDSDIDDALLEHDDFTPDPMTPIPHEDLVRPPPPRFPPPVAMTPPAPPPPPQPTPDLAIPLPPRRENTPIRQPKPEPIALRDLEPPPPRPPPPVQSPTPDLEVNIEAPVEAMNASSLAKPASAPLPPPPPENAHPPVQEPEIEIEAPSNAETWNKPEPANAEKTMPLPPPEPAPSSSRGLLFALLALAVLLGLVAFYFVSR